ncbi:DapH/DapD/GlmU-related protein [candidate division CSSED10-310 bacterium]|uniref:DapH/DapD/GlmU-related protein n=1 Tax=candidate division CSSED10-310 bacterium TaxID=2855610 RepID=A0ABV6YV41_UNCC1
MKQIDERDVAKTSLQTALTSQSEGPFQKYKRMVSGQVSLPFFIWFELLTTLLCNFPGAAGFLLRKLFYPSLFQSVGHNVIFGKNMTIRHPKKIHLGNNIILDDNVVLDAKGENNQGITIGDGVMIARNTIIACKEGDISIGDNTNISSNCAFHSESKVSVGSNVLFAAYCYVVGGGRHNFDRIDIPIIQQGSTSEGIAIGDNCWFGAHVCVLDGVTINNDSIIAAGAIVKSNVPAYSIVGGVPAKIIKSRIEQKNPEEIQ